MTQAEVRERYPEVPDELNAYAAIEAPAQRIFDYVTLSGQSGRPQWPAGETRRRFGEHVPREDKLLGEWCAAWMPSLESNQIALADVKQGLKRPLAWNRHWTNTEPWLVHTTAMLLQAESEIASAEGRTGAAVEGITNLLRIAWVIDGMPRDEAFLCTTLIRTAALDSLENLFKRNLLDDSQLASIDAG